MRARMRVFFSVPNEVNRLGDEFKVDRFMNSPPLRAGYWWHNETQDTMAEFQTWLEVVAPLDNNNKLFGYDQAEFLAKQYK